MLALIFAPAAVALVAWAAWRLLRSGLGHDGQPELRDDDRERREGDRHEPADDPGPWQLYDAPRRHR